ncbi:MAG TPA: LysM domain-containing protein [Chitinophagaceae bacterium]|nr:LysM domain-containing protein [Chitinophagaceae bacterium]
MNRVVLFVFSILASHVIYAQSGDLMVQGSGQDMHLVHIVAPKENWYSIGRIYNISPKEIAPFNHLTIDNPLSIGQQLNIPLTAANYTKGAAKAGDESLIALYQSKAGGKATAGYLKVKTALSPLANKANSAVAAKEVVAPPVAAKKDPVVARPEPVKEDVKIVPAKPEPVAGTTVSAASFKGGSFKSQYEPSGKSSSGAAGVFKSTSGWQDGRYYALINNVPVGTIVKITNAASGKSVYAKVLGNLADMKENAGLTARVSDAAASELDGEGRFDVDVKY